MSTIMMKVIERKGDKLTVIDLYPVWFAEVQYIHENGDISGLLVGFLATKLA